MIPASLFGRLTLILIVGMLAVQSADLWMHLDARAAILEQGHARPAATPRRFDLRLALTSLAVIAWTRTSNT
jgi:hypothetical protein